jgi:hypothetical protein
MGQRRDRRWTEDLRVYDEETGAYLGIDRGAGARAMLEVETILAREGGGIMVMPIRVEQPPQPNSLTQEPEMVNIGYIFEHVFAPTAGRVPAPAQNGGTPPEAAGATFPQAPDPVPAQPVEAFADEPAAVMPQAGDPAAHTAPRASDLPEPAPVAPADLVPRTS